MFFSVQTFFQSNVSTCLENILFFFSLVGKKNQMSVCITQNINLWLACLFWFQIRCISYEIFSLIFFFFFSFCFFKSLSLSLKYYTFSLAFVLKPFLWLYFFLNIFLMLFLRIPSVLWKQSFKKSKVNTIFCCLLKFL